MIPEAAVEAAAEWLPHSGDCEVRPERDCTCWKARVDLMRAALEAAAPHMRDGAAVTTIDELDALPFETVIRDAEGHILERWGDDPANVWVTMMVSAFIPRGDIALPATIIYRPTL